MTILDRTKESEPCDCYLCVSYCTRPGWMTPEEAERAINSGYGGRLMLDWWELDEEFDHYDDYYEEDVYVTSRLYVLCPALAGYEGKECSSWPVGMCSLLQNEKCEIHNSGFKPLECRVAHHAAEHNIAVHKAVAELWDTPEAKALISKWRQENKNG